MTQPTCETCRHYCGTTHGGRCRRHAPVMPLIIRTSQEMPREEGRWPEVYSSYWCGEHERKDAP